MRQQVAQRPAKRAVPHARTHQGRLIRRPLPRILREHHIPQVTVAQRGHRLQPVRVIPHHPVVQLPPTLLVIPVHHQHLLRLRTHRDIADRHQQQAPDDHTLHRTRHPPLARRVVIQLQAVIRLREVIHHAALVVLKVAHSNMPNLTANMNEHYAIARETLNAN